MDHRKAELKVGLAVIASIVILVGGILWGKGFRLSIARYKIQVEFRNIGGMETGANVLANGVVKGRVTNIFLRDGKVIVEAMVDRNVMLFSDYAIAIESPTLMAGKALAIYPGGRTPMANVSQVLQGTDPVGMAEAMAVFQRTSRDVAETLDHLNSLLLNLNAIAGDSNNRRNLSGLLEDAGDAAAQTSEFLTANRAQFGSTLDKLDSAMTSFQRVAGQAEMRLAPTMSSLDSAAQSVSALASSARAVVDRLSHDDNTAGRLLNEDSLYIRLNHTLAEVDSLARDIRKNGMKQKIVLF